MSYCLHEDEALVGRAIRETQRTFYEIVGEIDARCGSLPGDQAYTSRVDTMLVVEPCGCVSRCHREDWPWSREPNLARPDRPEVGPRTRARRPRAAVETIGTCW